MFGDCLVIVYNGIIENYQELWDELKVEGYVFIFQIDIEVVVYLIEKYFWVFGYLYEVVKFVIVCFCGVYVLVVVYVDELDYLVVCWEGSLLVVGVGIGENFIVLDQFVLLFVIDCFMFLEEGDIVDICWDLVIIYDCEGILVECKIICFEYGLDFVEKGEYWYFMLKEIYE